MILTYKGNVFSLHNADPYYRRKVDILEFQALFICKVEVAALTNELVDGLQVSPATLSTLMKDLCKRGFAAKGIIPGDKRAVCYGLTPLGKRLFTKRPAASSDAPPPDEASHPEAAPAASQDPPESEPR